MNKGEKNGSAKLTAGGVRRLRKLKGKVTQAVAAESFAISRSQVSQIWSGKYWPEVE